MLSHASEGNDKDLASYSPEMVRRRIFRFGVRIFTLTHILLYRLTGGALCGHFLGAPVLLLTTIGRKSGKARTKALFYITDGDDLIITASNGGRSWSPAWWLNLRSQPAALVQVGRQTIQVTAEQVVGKEKECLWKRLTQIFPTYGAYQEHTVRDIPVVRLRATDANENSIVLPSRACMD
jgi:deazaflavin-dependent oxidoreductase (nitroreductase family)